MSLFSCYDLGVVVIHMVLHRKDTDMEKTMDQQRKTSSQQVLAISARDLAGMLDVSLRQVWRLNSAGKLPRPIRLGGSVRWGRQEIMDWFAAGCPDRQTWTAMRGTSR
jgi:predicted DNA-binding transcriptional regulator AlpA